MDSAALRTWCSLSDQLVRLLATLGQPEYWGRYDTEALDLIQDSIGVMQAEALRDEGDPTVARLTLRAFIEPLRSLRTDIEAIADEPWLARLFQIALAMDDAAGTLEMQEEPLEAAVQMGRADALQRLIARDVALKDDAAMMLTTRAKNRDATAAAESPDLSKELTEQSP